MRPLALAFPVVLALAACSPAADAARAAHDAAARSDAGVVPGAAGEGAAERLSLYELPGDWRSASGDSLALRDLAGRVRVVAMVYTSCHATCPLIVRDLKAVEAALPPDRRDDVGFVLVSLDPERDTPGRLAEWGAATRLDPGRWTLLAGSDGAVRSLAVTLGVSYEALPSGEVAHTNVVTVLDADGVVAHRRAALDEPAAATVAAVARLLR